MARLEYGAAMLQITFNHEAPALTVALETHQQGFPISKSYRCESQLGRAQSQIAVRPSTHWFSSKAGLNYT